VGRPAWLALAGLGRTPAGSNLGDRADVSPVSKVAADASAMGRALGLNRKSQQPSDHLSTIYRLTPDSKLITCNLLF